ncbi:MAG TPA: hypothetical protein VM097_03650 [Mycobacteriales bacterium]|nr:hypothetical protein [Mycobacteriales bacterium]
MTLLQLPPARTALRHPAVRVVLLLVLLGPVWIAWLGKDDASVVRLRVLGLALAVAVAMSWDDRVHAMTASAPVGLPAVRRGRGLITVVLALVGFGLGCAAVPDGQQLHAAALLLESVALGGLLLALVAWFGRDGDPVLVVPLPALLISLVVLIKLPAPLTFLRAEPGSAGWPDERARWLGLLGLALVCVALLGRDPAARRPHLARRR